MMELIGAAGSLIGGMLGKSSADKEAKKNRQLQREQFNRQMEFNEREAWWSKHTNVRDYQRQVAQWNRSQSFAERQHLRAVQDRVADARAAGVHPLYALGMSANVGSATSIGGSSYVPGQAPSGTFADVGASRGDELLGAGIADAMSSVGRAYGDKQAQLQAQAMNLLQGLQLKASIEESQSRTAANFAEASYYTSEARRGTLRQMVSPGPSDVAAREALRSPYGSVTPKWTPAERWENEYGDVLQNVVGLGNFADDVWSQNARGPVQSWWQKVEPHLMRFGWDLFKPGPEDARGSAQSWWQKVEPHLKGYGWGLYKPWVEYKRKMNDRRNWGD